MDVNGTVAEGFEPVREAFAANFGALGDRGAAVTVYRDGHKVVDLWGGTRDVDGTEPWQRGTAQIVRSATKGVAAAVLLLLAQRGQLDLDAPVGAYWPEYKAHGKEHTRIRHLLAHRAACPSSTVRSPPPRPPTPTSRPRRWPHRRPYGNRDPSTGTTRRRTAG